MKFRIFLLFSFLLVGCEIDYTEHGNRWGEGKPVDIKMLNGELQFAFLTETGKLVHNYQYQKNYEIEMIPNGSPLKILYDVPFTDHIQEDLHLFSRTSTIISKKRTEHHDIYEQKIRIILNEENYHKIFGPPQIPLQQLPSK